MRIDSPSNPRVAAAVRAVAAGDRMLLEGRRMIEDAVDAGIRVEEVFFVQEEGSEENEEFLRRVRGEGTAGGADARRVVPPRQGGGEQNGGPGRVTPVSPRVLRRLSDLSSTRGIVALALPPHRTLASLITARPTRRSPLPSSPSKKRLSSNLPRGGAAAEMLGPEAESSLFLLLDDVQDPANVGAIVRSAEAFGVAGVVATPGCAWPFSPRALRASAGSALRVPIAARLPAAEVVAWTRKTGATLAGAEAHGGEPPESAASVRPLVLVVGSEGHGISPAVEAALDRRLTLPLGGRVESLNAAVATGLLLYVLTRA